MNIFSDFRALLLEVEINPKFKDEFEQDYSQRTGEVVQPNDFYLIQKNKWGRELRIYFDADSDIATHFEDQGYNVETTFARHPEYQYRISSKDLFWELVEYGYRLGENNPI